MTWLCQSTEANKPRREEGQESSVRKLGHNCAAVTGPIAGM